MKYAKRERHFFGLLLRLRLLLIFGLPVANPAQSPVSLRSTYTGEISSVLSGPGRNHSVYNGLFSLFLDSQLPFSDTPPALHLHAYYPHGQSGTLSYVNDLNTFSNIDFYDSPRLYELWIQSDLPFASLRIGLLALDTEFGVGGTDLSNLFINSTFGADATVSLNFPAPIFAVGALGARLEWNPAKNWSIRAAAYDGNPATGLLPDPSPHAAPSTELNRHGVDLALRSQEGALFAFEVGHAFSKISPIPREAAQARSHEEVSSGGWRAGFLYHTDTFSHSYDRFSPGGGNDRSRSGLPLVYVALDHDLWTDSRGRGLRGFARICQCPEDRGLIDFSINSGVVLQGVLPRRSRDLFGAAFAYTHLSNPVAAARQRYPENQAAGFAPHSESILELTYFAPLTDHWEVQPNLQVIFHPGANAEVDSAIVFSLRTVLRF